MPFAFLRSMSPPGANAPASAAERLAVGVGMGLALLPASIVHATATGRWEAVPAALLMAGLWMLLDALDDRLHAGSAWHARPIDGEFLPAFARLSTQGLLARR